MADDQDYLCVGVCLPDADEAYCIGCGRPWGSRAPDDLRYPHAPAVTSAQPDDPPPADDAAPKPA